MVGGISRRQLLQSAALGAAAVGLSSALLPEGTANASVTDDGVDAWEATYVGQVGNQFAFDTGGPTPTLLNTFSGSIFWAGQDGGSSLLKPGDRTLVRTVNGALDRAWANMDMCRGRILTTVGSKFTVSQDDGSIRSIDTRLNPVYWDLNTGDATIPSAMPIGTYVDLAGYVTSGDILASVISYQLPGASPLVLPDAGSGVTPNGATRTYSYQAIASRFVCSNGAGRCVTCSTTNSLQAAYPAISTTCTCCSLGCCDCARNCLTMVYLSCGSSFDVLDYCTARKYTLNVVDCGPCANTVCHTKCSTTTCSHVSKCGTVSLSKALVDLTYPTFARFDNPAVRTSFPCEINVTVPL